MDRANELGMQRRGDSKRWQPREETGRKQVPAECSHCGRMNELECAEKFNKGWVKQMNYNACRTKGGTREEHPSDVLGRCGVCGLDHHGMPQEAASSAAIASTTIAAAATPAGAAADSNSNKKARSDSC